MATARALSSIDEAEKFLSKVFEILDSYNFERFSEVFSTDLVYTGGLQENTGLKDFIQDVKKQIQLMPAMKTSHSREKIDIASDGTVYGSGHSKVLIETHPDTPITIPMIGVFTMVNDGPERGKISKMSIYKDRLPFMPFIQQLPGMSKT